MLGPMRRPAAFAAALAPILAACVEGAIAAPSAGERVGEAALAQSVDDATWAGCDTNQVAGLAAQVAAQASCFAPGAYVPIPAQPNLDASGAEMAWLEQPAADALVAALSKNPGLGMQVNSALRTVVHQYMLSKWADAGMCGISLAASPGQSNHESGLALDVQQYGAWLGPLQNEGFHWLGNNDPWHFDYAGPGAVDFRGTDVRAFQHLWNVNNPGDPIDEDGAYGPQTGARVAAAPAGGFAQGADCGAPPAPKKPDLKPSASLPDAPDVFADGASKGAGEAFEGETFHVALAVTDTGDGEAASVKVGVEVDGPWVAATAYVLESDAAQAGTFVESDANADPSNPPHDAPLGESLRLSLGHVAPGETARVVLTLLAAKYSIGLALPAVRFWVTDVDDRYHQAAFSDAPTGDGSQTGGTLAITAPVDVYARDHWEWGGGVREGWKATSGWTIAVDEAAGAAGISVKAGGPSKEPGATSPTTTIDAATHPAITLRARRAGGTGEGRVEVATDAAKVIGEGPTFAIALPDDGAFHEVAIDAAASAGWVGNVTRLRIVPFASGEGTLDLDWVRVGDAPGGAGGAGGQGGGPTGEAGAAGAAPAGAAGGEAILGSCGCDLARRARGGEAAVAIAIAGMAAARRRRRSRSGASTGSVRAPRRLGGWPAPGVAQEARAVRGPPRRRFQPCWRARD